MKDRPNGVQTGPTNRPTDRQTGSPHSRETLPGNWILEHCRNVTWALLTKPEAAAVLAEPDAAALAPGQAEQEEAQAKTRTSSYIKIGGKIWEGGGEEKIEKIFG